MENSETTRPYLIRAIYDWCVDGGLTPYISVSVSPEARVPNDYVKGGEIILNVGPDATHNFSISNEEVKFLGRFSGRSSEVQVPIRDILAIYSKETGQGLTFIKRKDSDSQVDEEEKALDSDVGKPRLNLVPISPSTNVANIKADKLSGKKRASKKRKSQYILKRIK